MSHLRGERYNDGFARISPSPYEDVAPSLQHHVIAKQPRKAGFCTQRRWTNTEKDRSKKRPPRFACQWIHSQFQNDSGRKIKISLKASKPANTLRKK